ncbi:MAG TPA: c-type cytochrome [Gemmatimonadaceae bacterium]|nr:c-type cytochrome [Gemmatimonadaceae bacterium]
MTRHVRIGRAAASYSNFMVLVWVPVYVVIYLLPRWMCATDVTVRPMVVHAPPSPTGPLPLWAGALALPIAAGLALGACGAVAIRAYGCGSCHTIPGIPGADALVGPPLQGLVRRAYVGGVLPNTPDNLVRWIRHPRQVSPRTAMPELGVTDADARDIAAYLYSRR